MVTVTRRDDSELGTWTLVDSRPGDLVGLVESIWFFDGESATRRERHFPTGTLDLIVHLGGGQDRFRVCRAARRGRARRPASADCSSGRWSSRRQRGRAAF
jgi:hypothetical protein